MPARYRTPPDTTPEAYHVPRMPLPMLCWRLGGNNFRVLVRVRWLPSMHETERYVPSNCLGHWHEGYHRDWDDAYARTVKKKADDEAWRSRKMTLRR